MSIAVYPGSFDPVTFGHLDIIERAARFTDRLIVGVLNNSAKTPLFSVEERILMIKEAVRHLPNVEVKSFSGLTVNFARSEKADFMIRGLRAVTDFEYELQLSQTNRKLAPDVDTVFLTTSLEYAYLSSSSVKEIASFGGDISMCVPPEIEKLVRDKYAAGHAKH